MRLQAGSSGSTESTVNSEQCKLCCFLEISKLHSKSVFWLEINEVIAQDGFIMISVKVSKKM